LCIPVFDTLRVMVMRMIRGVSPSSPDKTHLHHLFIELGYSHIGTTVSIISMNLFVVMCWFVAYKLGLSVDVQLYIVIALGVLMTFGFWLFIKSQIRNNTVIYRVINKIGSSTCMNDKKSWRVLQARLDKISNI
jgi:UDP-N-acetylmuramyl pentapeptide phosphotransferase/UDP-N-acetylglucosamine-1-phosphate transferase